MESPSRGPDDPAAEAEEDRPGDPVCWLRWVCPECGAIADGEPQANCQQCGAQLELGR
jgi:rubrerythrin